MRNKQLGVTAIGWLILLTPFAIVVYAGIRLAPVYLNYMKVAQAPRAGPRRAQERPASTPSPSALHRQALRDRHGRVSRAPRTSKITRDGGEWVVEAIYDDDAPLFCQRLPARQVRQGHKDRQWRHRHSALACPARARPMSDAHWPARWVREQLGYEPRDLALFRAALTHRSAAGANNERLEFLGDCGPEPARRRELYVAFPQATEGDLSRLRARLVSARAAGGDRRRARPRRASCNWAPAS